MLRISVGGRFLKVLNKKTEQVKPKKSRSRYNIDKAFIACYSQLLIFLGECINYCVCVCVCTRACVRAYHANIR